MNLYKYFPLRPTIELEALEGWIKYHEPDSALINCSSIVSSSRDLLHII
jgi:hypothetical protein